MQKAQHKNRSMKIQDDIVPLKLIPLVIVDPEKNDLEEHPDKEFKWMAIAMSRRENKEVRKSVESEEISYLHLKPTQAHLLSASFNFNSHIYIDILF